MSRRERLQAELDMVTLEEAFVEKKLAGELTQDDRTELRDARRAFRENWRVPVENGAQPAEIGAEVEMEEEDE